MTNALPHATNFIPLGDAVNVVLARLELDQVASQKTQQVQGEIRQHEVHSTLLLVAKLSEQKQQPGNRQAEDHAEHRQIGERVVVGKNTERDDQCQQTNGENPLHYVPLALHVSRETCLAFSMTLRVRQPLRAAADLRCSVAPAANGPGGTAREVAVVDRRDFVGLLVIKRPLHLRIVRWT